MRRRKNKKCPGCNRMVSELEHPTTFEHPATMFKVCGDCCHLLIQTPPGYLWRMKLLASLERKSGLKASQRKKTPDADEPEAYEEET